MEIDRNKRVKTYRMHTYCKICNVQFNQPKNHSLCGTCNGEQQRIRLAPLIDEFYSKGCAVCGETDRIVLEAHHIKGRNGDKNISNLIADHVSYARLKEELTKCVPVCANDHKRIHAGIRKLPENNTNRS